MTNTQRAPPPVATRWAAKTDNTAQPILKDSEVPLCTALRITGAEARPTPEIHAPMAARSSPGAAPRIRSKASRWAASPARSRRQNTSSA